MTILSAEVFCDYLDTTYSAESPIAGSVSRWVHENGGDCFHRDEKSTKFNIGLLGGTLIIETAKKYTRISASGQVLAHYRSAGLFLDYLSELSCEPHNISRIDVSMDLPVDGADVIDSLRERYSSGVCPLGRKALPVKYNLGARADGRLTGTFYAGGRRCKARVKAAVYDKAQEALEVRGEHIPPTTRYEMRIKGEKGRAGPSLRDAAEPTALFWHHASPSLLKAPDVVPAWVSGWEGGWLYDKRPSLLPAEALERTIEFSLSLDTLIEQADEIGPYGRAYLMRLLERKVLGTNLLDS